MLQSSAFFQTFGTKTHTSLGSPKLWPLDRLELPRDSIFHYMGNGVELGPSNDEYVLRDPDRVIFIEHVLENGNNMGTPRAASVQTTKLINDYKMRYRRFRPVRKVESVLHDPKILLVENYAMLPHLYRYFPSIWVKWYSWRNQFAAVCKRINALAPLSSHQHWLVINAPDVLPTLSELHTAERKVVKDTLEIFNNEEDYFLLDLWTWLGDLTANSELSKLSPVALPKVNIIFTVDGHWYTFNLGMVNDWITGRGNAKGGTVDNKEIQVAILKGLTRLFESKTVLAPVVDTTLTEGGPSATANGTASTITDSDLNVIGKTAIRTIAKVQTIDTGVKARADEMAEIGMLSGAEYRRVQKLAEVYKTIPSPYGKGTVSDLLTITPADLAMPNVPAFKDNEDVIDKSMLSSRLEAFDKHYFDNLYRKDLTNVVMGVQKFGVAVTDYKVEKVIDAMGGYENHTVKLVPVVGRPSTIHFKLPIVDDRGVFTANGVKYRLRRQRGDMPIRKVKPSVVALTSYTAKLFVTRSARVDSDYWRWVLNKIVMAGLDDTDLNVTALKMARVAVYDTALPRPYAEMAERIESVKISNIDFYFNYSKRTEVYDAAIVKQVESKKMVFCGFQGKIPVVMDFNGAIYTVKDGDYTPVGDLETLLKLDLIKAPLEKITLGIYGQELPIAVVLGYLIGLTNLCKLLKIEFRRVQAGGRAQLQPDEWALRFKDETLIFNRNDRLGTMVLGSLKGFKHSIVEYPVDAFDNKEVYVSLLEDEGITLRYIREIKTLNQNFVDHITEDLLKQMGEPTVFGDLLVRACEMLQTNDCPDEVDTTQMRIKGYERFPAAVHTELMKAIRTYSAQPATAKAAIEMPPNAVWQAIQQDPAIALIEESNPIHNLKELEIVTYSGTGGRSGRSMVKRTRQFHRNDMGVISEATVDSGDVGIISYLTADPGLTNMRGVVAPWDGQSPKATQLISTSMLISPCSDSDDKL